MGTRTFVVLILSHVFFTKKSFGICQWNRAEDVKTYFVHKGHIGRDDTYKRYGYVTLNELEHYVIDQYASPSHQKDFDKVVEGFLRFYHDPERNVRPAPELRNYAERIDPAVVAKEKPRPPTAFLKI